MSAAFDGNLCDPRSTTGLLVGLSVAEITPGPSLNAATSRLPAGTAELTEFGTGRDAVGLAETTTRGRATASLVLDTSWSRLGGSPKLALPSVTGIGGKDESWPAVFFCKPGSPRSTGAAGTSALAISLCAAACPAVLPWGWASLTSVLAAALVGASAACLPCMSMIRRVG